MIYPLWLAYMTGGGEQERILRQMLVFGFVLLVILIGAIRRTRQQKMWHETVRLALEKGQPIPPALSQWGPMNRSWRYRGTWPLARGLVLIGIGVGLYLVNTSGTRTWAPLPICIGAAFLLIGAFNSFRCPPPGDSQDPAPRQ